MIKESTIASTWFDKRVSDFELRREVINNLLGEGWIGSYLIVFGVECHTRILFVNFILSLAKVETSMLHSPYYIYQTFHTFKKEVDFFAY